MELNRSNMKKIMLLIAFAVGLLVGLQHVDILVSIFWTIISMLQPLLAGLCIAYILNVPMKAIENSLFVRLPGPKGRENKILRMIRRPVSLLLSIILVIGILLIAIFIVGPELGRTIGNLMQSIPIFFQNTQNWAEEMLKKYPDIVKQISEIKIDWSALIQQAVEFVKNGAGGVVNSTIGFAGSVANGMMNTAFSFIFAMYMLLQKEKTLRAGSPCVLRLASGKGGGFHYVRAHPFQSGIFQIYFRSVPGSVYFGIHVLCGSFYLPVPLCSDDQCNGHVPGSHSYCGCVYCLCAGGTPDSYGEPNAGCGIRNSVPGDSADRGKFHLSSCNGLFYRAAAALGLICRHGGRRGYGNIWYAALYPGLFSVPCADERSHSKASA